MRVFPKADEMKQFENHAYGFQCIFTGYADFESIWENTDEKIQCPQCVTSLDNNENNQCAHSYSIETRKHRAMSVSFIIIDRYGRLVHEFCYTGYDVIIQFVRDILRCEEMLVHATKFNRYMIFNDDGRSRFENASTCYICSTDPGAHRKNTIPFTEENPKVRDHVSASYTIQ